MIRHVVMWKLEGENRHERLTRAEDLAADLTALTGVVPGLLEAEAGSDASGLEANWDLVLISDFPDQEALDAYQEHPAHLAVAGRIKAFATDRACVDFTL